MIKEGSTIKNLIHLHSTLSSMDEQTLERFETYINRTDTCWLWIGSLMPNGYGRFGFQRKNWYAHRLMYLQCYGELPKGYEIAHAPIICHNRACVNPDHLEAVSPKINTSHRLLDGTDQRGEKNGSAKLTIEQVLEIRKSNKSQRSLAKEFSVCQVHIGRIINKKQWTHIDEAP
jgi:hypothetical protein